ncbi:MAG: metal-dependent hydrolase family protein [Sulfobacillus sp.]
MKKTLLRNVTLIDGNGQEPLPSAAIIWDQGKIVEVGLESQIAVPPGADILDGGGGYLMPGFIDSHVHFFANGIGLEAALMTPPSLVVIHAVHNAEKTLHAGITSVRDAGGTDAGFKRAQVEGLIQAPRMKIAIKILSITGGHGDEYFPALGQVTPLMPMGLVCDGPDEVLKAVREVLRAGADVIKVATTGGVLSTADHPSHTQFSPEELNIIVREAGYRGAVPAMAHAQGAEGIKNAIRAGFASIEHGIYLDDEAIDMMLTHGTYLVPTLHAPLSVIELAESERMIGSFVKKAHEVVEIHQQSIARAYQAGVKIAMGTDCGVGIHGTNLRELELMCQIGMSPMQAIVASTKTAAECIGWAGETGTLVPGKWADLVVTRENPLTRIASLKEPSNIALVVQAGKVVKRTEQIASGAIGDQHAG